MINNQHKSNKKLKLKLLLVFFSKPKQNAMQKIVCQHF
jgi:hypothetical protein